MQVLTLPARRGPQWLVEGLAIFRSKPALLAFLVLGYWLTMVIISAIPYLGQVIGFILIPAFSVSLMNACKIIGNKEAPPPQILFSGFHRNVQTLFKLGIIYILATLFVLGVTALLDDGVLFRMFVLGQMPSAEAQADGATSIAALSAVVLLIPLAMAFWFAPVLAAWHDMSAGKSLFFSLIACARNWRAFLTYSLAISVACLIVPRLLVAMLQADGTLSRIISAMISLIILPTLYASFYVSYTDIFAKPDDEA